MDLLSFKMKTFMLLIVLTCFSLHSEEINSGFIFIDGVYEKTPYNVTLKDKKIYINNFLYFDGDKQFPQEQIIQNCIAPDELSSSSTIEDSVIEKYVWDKLSYVASIAEPGKMIEDQIEFLRGLPFVANVDNYSSYKIKLTDNSGVVLKMGLITPRSFRQPYTEEEENEILNRNYSGLKEALLGGSCRFLSKGGSALSFRDPKGEMVSIIVSALDTTLTNEEKTQKLLESKIFSTPGVIVKDLLNNFVPNEQLQQRLDVLKNSQNNE